MPHSRTEKSTAPVRLSALMADVLKRSALPKRREMSGLDAAWAHAAGPDVARRSRPLALKAGELTVAFESAALRQEVECFRKAEILARLAAAWTESRIAKLKCVVRRG
ncbi:MAG TPA: DUF721 domain-containing protein [Planctomycetota bacterium]|nr:DUF721 domain-containing protein [Planctomycetota bacterium]